MLFTFGEPISIQTSFSEVIQVPCWQDAMTDELVTLEANQTWDIVSLPANTSVVGNEFIP